MANMTKEQVFAAAAQMRAEQTIKVEAAFTKAAPLVQDTLNALQDVALQGTLPPELTNINNAVALFATTYNAWQAQKDIHEQMQKQQEELNPIKAPA